MQEDKRFRSMTYSYARTGEAAVEGSTPARSQSFHFFEDRLVGHDYVSSFKEDSTEFDGNGISRIRKGVTTRNEILRLFGAPGGRYVYPLAERPGGETLVYLYAHTTSTGLHLQHYRKLLAVSIDSGGVVTDVKFSELRQ